MFEKWFGKSDQAESAKEKREVTLEGVPEGIKEKLTSRFSDGVRNRLSSLSGTVEVSPNGNEVYFLRGVFDDGIGDQFRAFEAEYELNAAGEIVKETVR